MTTVPYIPDNAPFNAEQRAWLNGFLAGMYSSAPGTAVAEKPASLHFGVYFSTQTGTAERLAKKLVKELKSQGHTADIASLDKTTPAQLATQQNALILASTYGEGDPPEGSVAFRDALFSDAAPQMSTLRYSVFALGDHHYEHFCKFGVDLDERLQALGATRFIARVESDVDVDSPFDTWKKDLRPHLSHKAAESNVAIQTDRTGDVPAGDVKPLEQHPEPEHVHTRENPFHAELRERTPLTSDISSKLTMHLSIGLDDGEVHYQAGDACGVIAQNDPALIADILAHLPFADGCVDIPKVGTVPVSEALLHHLQPTRLSRKIVQHFADKTGARELTALLVPEQAAHLETFLYDRGLIDLLLAYPGALTEASELVSILPRLAPRLYSISSSPAAHGREVHCTIAVVRYRSHNRERGGIASTMLADRVDLGQRLPIYIQPNKKFRLPAPDVPMIMVGPGTGIAPFRSFLHERQALGHTGKNWLFFGERSASTDFLYRAELEAMQNGGHLTRLETAFSRDQAQKIYVQDRMLQHGKELYSWFQQGAQFYICGDASRMAKDVDAALHTVFEKHGNMNADAARDAVSQLHDDRRYHRDVY